MPIPHSPLFVAMKHHLLILCLIFLACNRDTKDLGYESSSLQLKKVTDHCYQHTSYLQTESFGKVACNGLVVVENKKAFVFDTPTTDSVSKELMQYLQSEGIEIRGVIPTHFHVDCLGGLKAFHDELIPSYAHELTLKYAMDDSLTIPLIPIKDSLHILLEGLEINIQYYGSGHTRDNIVAYIPQDDLLFGGCLVKSMKSGKGNLADADTLQWSATVSSILRKHPDIKKVVPGHGALGGKELLLYTEKMFKSSQ